MKIEVEDWLPDGLVMDARHEVLPDGEWVRWVRRETGKDVFAYRHREHGTYVLAEWRKKEGVRVCTELLSSEVPFDRGGWEGREWVRLRFRSAQAVAEEMLRGKARVREERIEMAQEAQEDQKSKVRWLRRKGMEEVAKAVEKSKWVTDRQTGGGVSAMREALQGGRIISGG